MSNFVKRVKQLSPKRLALLAVDLQKKVEALEAASKDPIAIIGMGCRFPGAKDPQAFWQLLRDGSDVISEVPADRWDIDKFYDPDPDAPGKMNTRFGGFLEEVDRFDPHFFGISPREAATMDPQHRLLLEVSWEALEYAGLSPDKIEESLTGVFVGICGTDYMQKLMTQSTEDIDAYLATGNSHAIASGRLSYTLGIQGPSLSVDTACSSSLVAVHLACLTLRSKGCDLALAGGVNMLLTPQTTITLSKSRMMAPDGRCKAFDASADGFVRGEGCGIVVLKRLSDALADGDHVLAVVAGSAVNQDGRSSGITAPNGPSQEAVIRKALSQAGLKAGEIQYVETHGTGTSLGDPIEINALGKTLAEGREPENRLRIGSVKTNIGHLESAAGVAGLIKLILALQHKQIPPHLHLNQPSPHIPWNELAIDIPTDLADWPTNGSTCAGAVSSFGFSGTNAHLVITEAPKSAIGRSEIRAVPALENNKQSLERPSHLLCLSAKSPDALLAVAKQYKDQLADHPDGALSDVSFSANTGRSHLSHRAALIASSNSKMETEIAGLLSGTRPSEEIAKRPEVVFLFTGQGSQYPDMGKRLYETQPTFRKALEQCQEGLSSYLEKPLISILFSSPSEGSDLDQTGFTQPALFALEYSLAQLWRSWGVEPAAMLGHSVGEYVAACVAGVFSLEDGLKLIAERSRLMQELPPTGKMAAVFAPQSRVTDGLAKYDQSVSIAAINGPEHTVISGESNAIDDLIEELSAEGIKSRKLNVSHAFHSPQMEPVLDEFRSIAGSINYASPKIGVVSNVTGDFASNGHLTSGEYWRNHVREPVSFFPGMGTLYDDGYRIFLEIGPNPVLLGMAGKSFPDTTCLWLPSLRKGKEDWQPMLTSLGAMYRRGLDIDWQGFDRDYSRRKLVLPTYPFQRERCWIESENSAINDTAASGSEHAEKSNHPLLGYRLPGPFPSYKFNLDARALSMLDDHLTHGAQVMPTAAYLEMILGAAAESIVGHGRFMLEDVAITQAVIIPQQGSRVVQLTLLPEKSSEATFRFHSCEAGQENQQEEWQQHAEGRLRLSNETMNEEQLPLDEIQARCAEGNLAKHYDKLRARGIQVGERSQLAALWRRDGEALGRIAMSDDLQTEQEAFQIHPAVLDTGLQLLEAALPASPASKSQDHFMLLNVDRIRFFQPPDGPLWCHAVMDSSECSKNEVLTGRVALYDDSGATIAAFEGLHFKHVSANALFRTDPAQLQKWLYEVKWKEQPLTETGHSGRKVDFISDLSEIADAVMPRIDSLAEQNNLSRYDELLPRLDALCSLYVLQALTKLGWEPKVGDCLSSEPLMNHLGILKTHARLFGRLLEMLEQDGLLVKDDEQWQVARELEFDDPKPVLKELLRAFPENEPEIAMLGRCGDRFAEALNGAVDPLQLLFPSGSIDAAERLYRDAPSAKTFNALLAQSLSAAIADLPSNRRIRILEIGAGTGGTTVQVLPLLPADQTEYVFSDMGRLFIDKAKEKLREYEFVRYEVLDIEQDPVEQGFDLCQFDIIIAANVLHAARDLKASIANVKKLLAPAGLLILLEGINEQRFSDLTVGLTEGWWSFSDSDLRTSYALIPDTQWLELLPSLGFTEGVSIPNNDERTGALATQAVILARGQADVKTNSHYRSETQRKGTWVIFQDDMGVGAKLSELLQHNGQSVVEVTSGEDYEVEGGHYKVNPSCSDHFQKLLRDLKDSALPTCRGVVYLLSLDSPITDDMSIETLEETQRYSTGGALSLVQALVSGENAEATKLWLVTSGVQALSEQSDPVNSAQAPLWGLGKVVALEHPELQCCRVDLGPIDPIINAEMLLAELCAESCEDQIACRDNIRYVPRLVKSEIDLNGQQENEEQALVSDEATYLITGGLAGLGLLFAEWLVQQGAKNLVLLGRSEASQKAKVKLEELKNAGAQIIIESIDVSDESAMRRVFDLIDKKMPPLRGIIHSAGVVDDGVLLQQDWGRFEKVMAAKVTGSWVLHQLSKQLELDFFLLFSTGVALIGSAGQANHAAANAFLDSLAHYRRSQSLTAMSINWGAWSEIGAAAEHELKERITGHGKNVIAPDQGIKILEGLLYSNPTQIGVLPGDLSELLDRSNRPPLPAFLTDLASGQSVSQRETQADAKSLSLVDRLEATPLAKRWNVLFTAVKDQARLILGLGPSKPLSPLQPLGDLGLDSLMALEFRNALSQTVEQSLPATLLFDHPNIEELATYLADSVLSLEIPKEGEGGQQEEVVKSESGLGSTIDELSEDEMADLLEKKLSGA